MLLASDGMRTEDGFQGQLLRESSCVVSLAPGETTWAPKGHSQGESQYMNSRVRSKEGSK